MSQLYEDQLVLIAESTGFGTVVRVSAVNFLDPDFVLTQDFTADVYN